MTGTSLVETKKEVGIQSEVIRRWFFESSLDQGRCYNSSIVHALCTEIMALRGELGQLWTVRRDINYPESLNIHVVTPEEYRPDVIRPKQ